MDWINNNDYQWSPNELGTRTRTGQGLTPKQAAALSRAGFNTNEIEVLKGDIDAFNRVLRAIENGEYSGASDPKPLTVVNVGTLKGKKPTASTLRWPMDTIGTGTDYVFFQFGKYPAPFGRDEQKIKEGIIGDKPNADDIASAAYRDRRRNSDATAAYQNYAWGDSLDPDVEGSIKRNIMLPMPQDLSTETQSNWQGKQFTATGRAAVAALAAGNFAHASNVVSNIAGSAKALQTALNTTVLNSIPGVGGNFEFNDISGSTRGIVINPNAELLYDSPEMREIGMIFKMVPQSSEEALNIRRICQAFRMASLPRWGGKGGGEMIDKLQKDTDNMDFDQTTEGNWIRVPNLCKFTFMKGANEHPYITQYKPCAISKVEVNYTPDGTYATYEDGAPVATELRVNFMETKLIFAHEIALEPGLSV